MRYHRSTAELRRLIKRSLDRMLTSWRLSHRPRARLSAGGKSVAKLPAFAGRSRVGFGHGFLRRVKRAGFGRTFRRRSLGCVEGSGELSVARSSARGSVGVALTASLPVSSERLEASGYPLLIRRARDLMRSPMVVCFMRPEPMKENRSEMVNYLAATAAGARGAATTGAGATLLESGGGGSLVGSVMISTFIGRARVA